MNCRFQLCRLGVILALVCFISGGTAQDEAEPGVAPAGEVTSAEAEAPPVTGPCATIIQSVTEQIQATPNDVVRIVEDAFIIQPSCACEIIKTAISVSGADPGTVQTMIERAIEIAPAQASTIRDCAKEALPDLNTTIDETVDAALFESAEEAESVTVPIEQPGSRDAFELGSAVARGLMGIGVANGSQLTGNAPFQVLAGAGYGYDSNRNTSGTGEAHSHFVRGTVGTSFGVHAENFSFDTAQRFSLHHYFREHSGVDDTFLEASSSVNMTYRPSSQWTLTDNFLIAYQVEPDHETGMSLPRREDQYFYAFNRIAAAFEVTPKISTETAYSLAGILYEDSAAARTEDRLSHLIAQEIRYQLSPKTALRLAYRYGQTNFDKVPRDYHKHYALGGFTHRISDRVTADLLAGSVWRRGGPAGNHVAPYAETAVQAVICETTFLRWAYRAGYEDMGLRDFDSRYGNRTSLTVTQVISPKLSLRGSIIYAHSALNGSPVEGNTDEQLVALHAGVSYTLFGNMSLNAGYQFVDYRSGLAELDYDRHRVSLEMQGMF